jgi:AraC-like DNA-binding protein
MEMGEITFIGFCSLAAINALFFSGYIWLRRDKNLFPAILFSLFMLNTAYRIVQMLLHDLQDDFNLGINLRLLFFFIPSFTLIGPLLYLYIQSVSLKDFRIRISHILHLIPFFIILITDLVNLNNFPLSPDNRKHYLTYCIEISGVLLQFLIYIIISYNFVQSLIKKDVPEKFPRENPSPYRLKSIVLVISILWLIYASYCFQTYFSIYLPTRSIEALYYSILSYWILYSELQGRKIISMNSVTGRYKSSGLTTEDAARYKSIILDYTTKNESYKDHNITLAQLAKQLKMTPHMLSQVINDQLNYNFNDFINSHRIEGAKKMLKDEAMSNFTIASIAYECGFNTLSAFNVAFKKFTGITPSQFRSMDK